MQVHILLYTWQEYRRYHQSNFISKPQIWLMLPSLQDRPSSFSTIHYFCPTQVLTSGMNHYANIPILNSSQYLPEDQLQQLKVIAVSVDDNQKELRLTSWGYAYRLWCHQACLSVTFIIWRTLHLVSQSPLFSNWASRIRIRSERWMAATYIRSLIF